ncbi:MAG: hypothetical protein AAGD28_18300 [Bacteroidota bacterium]
MNSAQLTIKRFLYSLKQWPQKILVLLSIPVFLSVLVHAFLLSKPSSYISSAKLELLFKEPIQQSVSNDSSAASFYEEMVELSQQITFQVKSPRVLHILGCRLTAYDLRQEEKRTSFSQEIGIKQPELMDYMLESMEGVEFLAEKQSEKIELDSLIDLSLDEFDNDFESLSSQIHLQWVPQSNYLYLKAFDDDQLRANYMVNTLAYLIIQYQEVIGRRNVSAGINAQKSLITQRRDSWEASKERLELEKQELNSGGGPSIMREISRKIFALKRNLVEVEAKINELREKIRDKREEESQAPTIISVRNEEIDQERLLLDLSKNLNDLRIINAELKLLQDRLKKYEEQHLKTFWEKEKNDRKALLEAQKHLQEVLGSSSVNLSEIRLVDSAKTFLPNDVAIWVLTAFSFFAFLALWLILLLKIQYFR